MFTKEEKYISDSELQKDASSKISDLLKNSQIPEDEISKHLTLFIERIPLQNIIFMYEIWKKILNVHGVVAEFGTRYGDNLALFLNLRGVLEPFNRSRKIPGFDTFSGFVRVDENDGNMAEIGDLSTTIDYEDYLEKF